MAVIIEKKIVLPLSCLYSDTLSFTKFLISSSVVLVPSLRITKALGISPNLSFGIPTTAASITFGCLFIKASNSAGGTWCKISKR